MEVLTEKLVSIQDILIEITTEGSIWDEIINNIISPNSHLKPELISEISIGYLENSDKVELAWEKGYFKYYFIKTVTNQVNSKTSSFHKNVRMRDYSQFDTVLDLESDEGEDDIDLKIEKEVQISQIKLTLKTLPISWFEQQMFIEYYYNNRTYRNIEEEYTIDHVLVWKTVKKVKNLLKEVLNENK